MPGIKEAFKMMIDGNCHGFCAHRGAVERTEDMMVVADRVSPVEFMLVQMEGSLEMHLAYDYSCDVRIAKDIEVGDRVYLQIISNNSAVWEKWG